MQRIQQKAMDLQKVCDAKGYGQLGLGVAGSIMLFVFCPMSIVAIAEPYWTFSTEVQGNSMSAKASLWDISTSVEIGDKSSESSMAMCGDEMQDSDECGKIGAVRFFVIATLLLSLVSAIALIVVFLNKVSTAALRRRFTLCGLGAATTALLMIFLGICMAASIDMKGEYGLNGAGFVFLVLELFFVMLSAGLVVYTLRCSTCQATAGTVGSQGQAAAATVGSKTQEQQPQEQKHGAGQEVAPTLLTGNVQEKKGDLEKGADTSNAGSTTGEIIQDTIV